MRRRLRPVLLAFTGQGATSRRTAGRAAVVPAKVPAATASYLDRPVAAAVDALNGLATSDYVTVERKLELALSAKRAEPTMDHR